MKIVASNNSIQTSQQSLESDDNLWCVSTVLPGWSNYVWCGAGDGQDVLPSHQEHSATAMLELHNLDTDVCRYLQ